MPEISAGGYAGRNGSSRDLSDWFKIVLRGPTRIGGFADETNHLIMSFFVVLAVGNPAIGQMRRATGDEQIVKESDRVVVGKHTEIYQHRMKVDPAFLEVTEDAYQQVEKLLGVKLDTATLGPKVQIYVSDIPSVCHVWKGYNHPQDPKGMIFLHRRAYLGAMRGLNATYIHELVHLFMWRYHSHTLREGFAEYIALKILPAGISASPVGSDGSVAIPADVIEYLGTAKSPPHWITTDPAKRRVYYLASYRLVKYLVEAKGLETFIQLYNSDSPVMEIGKLYGTTREEAIRAAGM